MVESDNTPFELPHLMPDPFSEPITNNFRPIPTRMNTHPYASLHTTIPLTKMFKKI